MSHLPLDTSADEKGKATAIVDEGIRPLDGQFRKAASYSTNDDSDTHDSAANASEQNPQGTAPRVMTDRELLLSLHQKVDGNHKWVKRQFGSILHNMTATHNAVKKNHYYLHQVFSRTWEILSHLYGEEDLKKMGLNEDFNWSAPPPKKFKKVKVPSLVASSYSSSCDTDENEDLDDTAADPTTTQDPNNAGAPPSSRYSSGTLVLIFNPFGHSMIKGEKFELVFKRVYYMGVFLLSYNSRSSKTFIGSSCKLKLYGGLILLLSFSACLFLINVYARMLNYISHHISSCISNSTYFMSNACMNYKI